MACPRVSMTGHQRGMLNNHEKSRLKSAGTVSEPVSWVW